MEAWEETLPVWRLWDRVGNQWRMGQSGAIALDYNPLFHQLDRMGLDADDYDALFDNIRIIEAEVLSVWQEQREIAEEEAKTR